VIVSPADPKKMRRPATRRKATPLPANDDGEPRRSEIITKWPAGEEMTPEEHKRRGDAADAMFQEMKRRIAEGGG
jgi:hypothetical protein